eukprot:TRINITY_DN4208_c0_g1_i4.p1 TRINITY_DN4208_c0_g1~~TRINITY_DN4208_c0_g1_i4.p1  ORF type:complete len:151 (-),score=34.65 TRINITY_DN4208_c0_g1_i4:76-528(-)
MVWQPDHIWKQQKGNGGKGGNDNWKSNGSGGSKGTGGRNWNRGDSKGGWSNSWSSGNGKSKGKGKTKRFSSDQKVWVGGIPDDVDWKALQDLMGDAGKVKWCEVFKGKSTGSGCVAFEDAASANQAVSSLNGAVLGSGNIIVDPWSKRDA